MRALHSRANSGRGVSFLSIFLKTNIRSDELNNANGTLGKDHSFLEHSSERHRGKLCFCCARFVFCHPHASTARGRSLERFDRNMGRRYFLRHSINSGRCLLSQMNTRASQTFDIRYDAFLIFDSYLMIVHMYE